MLKFFSYVPLSSLSIHSLDGGEDGLPLLSQTLEGGLSVLRGTHPNLLQHEVLVVPLCSCPCLHLCLYPLHLILVPLLQLMLYGG